MSQEDQETQEAKRTRVNNRALMRSLVHLVPVVARLVSGQNPAHALPHAALTGHRLNPRAPKQIALEAIEALEALIPEAVVADLARLGVKRARYGDPSRGDVKEGRLWDHPAWSRLSLTFSDQSVDTARHIYELCYPYEHAKREVVRSIRSGGEGESKLEELEVKGERDKKREREGQERRRKKEEKLERRAREDLRRRYTNDRATLAHLDREGSTLGDLLFHLLCHRKLIALSPKARPEGYDLVTRLSALESPLYALIYLSEGLAESPMTSHAEALITKTDRYFKTLDFTSLLDPALETLWPWLSPLITRAWLDAEPRRWKINKSVMRPSGYYTAHESVHLYFKSLSIRQRRCFEQLCDLAERRERLDLLIPFIGYYQALPDQISWVNSSSVASRINTLFEGVRLMDRESHLADFVELLRGATRLEAIARRVERTHPLDREWPDKLYLSVYQAAEMEPALGALREFTQALSPEVG